MQITHSNMQMELSGVNIKDILIQIYRISKLIMQMRSRGIEVNEKSDGSLVTNIDIWANEELKTILHHYFPEDELIGEEDDTFDRKLSKSIWFIDPIDGTSHFINHANHYFILLGRVTDGLADFGLCHDPVNNVAYSAFNNRSYLIKNDTFTQIRAVKWIDLPKVTMKQFTATQRVHFIKSFNAIRSNYCMSLPEPLGLLTGNAHAYFSFRQTHFWDSCALTAILRYAGFKSYMTDSEGNEMDYSKGIKSANLSFYPEDIPNEIIEWFKYEIKNKLSS